LSEGFFISFEGGEGAGKTTLINRIAEELRSTGFTVDQVREPGGTKFGEKIRDLLLHEKEIILSPYAELCLFLASRAQHIAEVIRPALTLNHIVLCDRFNDSTIAYQGAARGLGMENVGDFCQFITQGLDPDITFYLDIDPKIGLTRASKDRAQDKIESEKIAFHEKIRDAYRIIQQHQPKRVKLLDATKTAGEVFDEAVQQLQQLIRKKHV
jgi:dTMP kinase